MKKFFILLAVLVFIFFSVLAAFANSTQPYPVEEWEGRFAGGLYTYDEDGHQIELNNLSAKYMVTDPDGFTYVTGQARTGSSSGEQDIVTVCFDDAGNVVWHHIYKGKFDTDRTQEDGTNYDDRPLGIFYGSDQKVYVACSIGGNPNSYLTLLQYEPGAGGGLIKSGVFDGSEPINIEVKANQAYMDLNDDNPYDVKMWDCDSTYLYLAVNNNSGTGQILKVNKNDFSPVVYTLDNGHKISSICLDSQSNLYVISNKYYDYYYTTEYKFTLWGFDSQLNKKFSRTYNSTDYELTDYYLVDGLPFPKFEAISVQARTSEDEQSAGIYIIAECIRNNDTNIAAIYYDVTFGETWQCSDPVYKEYDEVMGMPDLKDPNCNTYKIVPVYGKLFSSQGESGLFIGATFWKSYHEKVPLLLRLSTESNRLLELDWYDALTNEEIYYNYGNNLRGMVVDAENSVYMIANCGLYSKGILILKYDSSGNRLWKQFYRNPHEDDAVSCGISVQESENSFYLGGSGTSDSVNDFYYDYILVKYNMDKWQVNPTTCDFGEVNVGSTSTPQTITISNFGPEQLTIDPVTITGTGASEFQLPNYNNSAMTIASGQSIILDVVFSPASSGAKEATLNIHSNDPDTPLFTVQLSGAAVDMAPSVSSTHPADGSTGIPVNEVITITFSKDVEPGIDYRKISLQDAGGQTVSTVNNINGNQLTMRPENSLAENTNYTVTIPARAIKDTAGQYMEEPYTFRFTTQLPVPDTKAPTVTGTDPKDNANNVPVYKAVVITFDENVYEDDAFEEIIMRDDDGESIIITTIIKGNQLIIRPAERLDFKERYTVTVPTGAVQDMAGNSLKTAYSISFSTQPTRNAIMPADNSTGQQVAPPMFRSKDL